MVDLTKKTVFKILLLSFFFTIGFAVAGSHLKANNKRIPPIKKAYYGYYGNVFTDVNRKDAEAALQLTMDQIIEYWNYEIEAKAFIYDTKEEIVKGITSGEISFIVLPTFLFLDLKDKYYLEPASFGKRGENFGVKHYLLVNASSNFNKASDLIGKKINIQCNKLEGIPFYWLKTIVMREGIEKQEVNFKTVEVKTNAYEVALPVFFKKVDACIVTESSYNTLIELNPQLSSQLKILDISPAYLEYLMCFCQKLSPKVKDFLYKNMSVIGTYPKGQQILTIFKIQKITLYKEEYIKNDTLLYQEYHKYNDE